MTRGGKKPEWQVKIAKERIVILFDEAAKAVKEDPELAKRYMKLAKRIGMRYNVRLEKMRWKFCKYCYNFFLPGKTCTQRLKNGKINIKCLSCNKVIRYPYR